MEEILKQILSELSDIKTDIKGLKDDVSSLKADVSSLKTDVSILKTDVIELKIQVKENTEILKALEHSAQVNKAEHDRMFIDIAHTKGSIEALRKDLSTVEVITAKNYSDLAMLKAVR